MIVYVATYPRCGSAVLRDSILRNFGIMTTNGYASEPEYPPEYQVRDAPEAVAGFRDGMVWDAWTRIYTVPQTAEVRQMLRAPALRYLTPETRERVAAQPEFYAVKTHELPHGSYFPGEVAVQMVRHPGAALVSYRKLTDATSAKQRSMEDYIRGAVFRGSWSAYHNAWESARLPRLALRYEDAFFDQSAAIEAIGGFLNVGLINVGENGRPAIRPYTLAEAHARNPTRNPGAGLDAWRADLSEAEHDLLWAEHGATAGRFGYGPLAGLRGAAA